MKNFEQETEEIEVVINQICEEIKLTEDLKENEDKFIKLVNLKNINTSKIAEIAFENEVFYPYEIYKDAPINVIKSMIEILKDDDTGRMTANKILCCLSVCGGEEVFNAFKEIQNNPPAWRAKLHVDPSFYAYMGGWSYDKDGNFMKTVFDKCYPLAKDTLEGKQKSPVKVFVKTNDTCELCGGHIVDLVQIDCSDKRLDFLETEGVITVKCCPSCVIYSDGDFSRYTLDGKSEIISSNGQANGYGSSSYEQEHEDFVNSLNENVLALGNEDVELRHFASWGAGSSIGGFTYWIQDCVVTYCPDCGKPMKYLSAIQLDTVCDGMEGYLYIEICQECKVTSVQYQQS